MRYLLKLIFGAAVMSVVLCSDAMDTNTHFPEIRINGTPLVNYEQNGVWGAKQLSDIDNLRRFLNLAVNTYQRYELTFKDECNVLQVLAFGSLLCKKNADDGLFKNFLMFNQVLSLLWNNEDIVKILGWCLVNHVIEVRGFENVAGPDTTLIMLVPRLNLQSFTDLLDWIMGHKSVPKNGQK